MVAAAENGRDFESILCYSISRFSRGGTNETGYYIHRLKLAGVSVIFTADGIPAYVSGTAGTYLCNQTMYSTLHLLAGRGGVVPAGFVHLPMTPAMVAAAGVDEPSMDASLMLRAVEVTLGVIARRLP